MKITSKSRFYGYILCLRKVPHQHSPYKVTDFLLKRFSTKPGSEPLSFGLLTSWQALKKPWTTQPQSRSPSRAQIWLNSCQVISTRSQQKYFCPFKGLSKKPFEDKNQDFFENRLWFEIPIEGETWSKWKSRIFFEGFFWQSWFLKNSFFVVEKMIEKCFSLYQKMGLKSYITTWYSTWVPA